MKKYIIFFFMLLPMLANAFDAEIDGIYYNFSGDEATVTYQKYENSKYISDYSGAIFIPASVTYNGKTYTVTNIGGYAFRNCSSLTSIIIPESVTTIGSFAFENCSELSLITIPHNVTRIGRDAFRKCSSLISITIPNNVTSIDQNTFRGCSSLISVTIPNSVTSIGYYAFDGCSSLTSITIGNSVSSIGSSAFAGCSSLTSITIPNSVNNIGKDAFSSCSSLTSIIIPNSVTSIGDYAFAYCNNLISITIPESVKNIGTGTFRFCGLTSLTIPNSITSIGNDAFSFCESLTSITLNSNTIVSASRSASTSMNTIFGDQVQEYVLGNNITDIGAYAFYGCNNLNSIILGDSISIIGSDAFPQAATIYTSIGKTLFTLWSSGCENIKETETGRNLPAPKISKVGKTASSLTILYINPYPELTETETISHTAVEKGENEIKLTGLRPYETYDFSFTLAFEDAAYERTYSFRTEPLTLTTQQPKVINVGNVIVAAESNLDDEETNVGFEWRRTDWTDEFASNAGTAYLYNGKMEGYIRNLYTEKLWKYRPYYESDSGNRYYGEWVGIDPTNTSYFEPTVHTYAQISVTGNRAEVKGYAMRGTDNVQSQGFMYWQNNTSVSLRRRAASVPSGATVVNASGNIMTATLEDLEYEATYNYVAFVTTSEGETFYGEMQTFTTSFDPDGIEEVKASEEATEVARYDLQGRMIAKPQKGINIIRYSDGTSKKVLVK